MYPSVPMDDFHETTPVVRSAPRRAARGFGDEYRDRMVGSGDAMSYVRFRAEQVAATNATVLLLGDTGTGKELMAREIHRLSSRGDRPLVTINCGALPASLIESELFGRERGAFTGAHATQIGRLELANRGTIFLDEIGELPLEQQPRLLRVLQEGQMERLGSPRTIDLDVRVIAATNRPLCEEVQAGRFRRDLFYRLNVFPITLPTLAERREDIPDLVRHLVKRLSRALGKPIDAIPDEVIETLQRCEWPGNIRELENVLQRAIILSPGTTLVLSEAWAPRGEAAAAPAQNGGLTLMETERRHITGVLEGTRWRIEGREGAAQILGLKPSTLRSRMSKLAISRPR